MGAVTVYRVIHLGVTVTVVRYTETQYSSLANNHTSLVAHHRTSETQPKSKLLTTTAYKLPELGNIQRTSSTEMCHQGFPNFSFPIFNRSGFRRGLAGSGSASSTSSSPSSHDPQQVKARLPLGLLHHQLLPLEELVTNQCLVQG